MKKEIQMIYRALLLAAAFLLSAAQGALAAPATKTIRSEKTMTIGSYYSMRVSVNADYVSWSSSNKSIATVSNDGTVYAKRKGTVTIKAKAVTNGTMVVYKCKIKVITQQASYIDKTIRLINKERRKYGLSSFTKNVYLQKAAQKRAREIALNRFSKKRPNGTSFTSAISMDYDFEYAAQSIACDFATPEAVVKAWAANSGSKANMISRRYADIGVGVYLAEDGYLYWVAIYGKKKKVM